MTDNIKTTYRVRQQYEQYPYPRRDPQDEHRRLQGTVLDPLARINHYCYAGREDFNNKFRILVAGGGTGDAAIFLAEQLRNKAADIVYLDVSSASTEVARQRAAERGLDNIDWLNGSLMDIEQLCPEKFDYINCCGVLHHLEDPHAGLRALKSVLKSTGAMALMVYGKYGRCGVYQMQELMRLVNGSETDLDKQLSQTITVLESLPETNWFKRAEALFPQVAKKNNIEIYDCFLHSRDRAYSVPELYQWIQSCGLHFVEFMENRAHYHPEFMVKDPTLLEQILAKPLPVQQAIAELICGIHRKHSFFVSRKKNTQASPDNLDNVPMYFNNLSAKAIYQNARDLSVGATLNINDKTIGTIRIVLRQYTGYLLKYIDGQRTLRQCFDAVRQEPACRADSPSNETLLKDFKAFYQLLALNNYMLLRHKSVPMQES